jgi:hypothetical protein
MFGEQVVKSHLKVWLLFIPLFRVEWDTESSSVMVTHQLFGENYIPLFYVNKI